jgi:hypothetical protein
LFRVEISVPDETSHGKTLYFASTKNVWIFSWQRKFDREIRSKK